MKTWNFRPSALSPMYGAASRTSLFDHYLSDGSTASQNGFSIPKPPPTSGNAEARSFIRTCQWNIHYLQQDWVPGRTSTIQQAHRVADDILGVDADVIILNEVGIAGNRECSYELDVLCTRLEDKGYTIAIAGGSFPTAMATRLPIKREGWFALDMMRSSVYMEVEVGSVHLDAALDEKDKTSSVEKQKSNPTTVTVFGTHLDHTSGRYRLTETQNLLSKLEPMGCDANDRTLIIGDFNQQRSCDYSKIEWEAICENKDHRNSPHDDGVSTELKNAGFDCCFDNLSDLSCNWNTGDPPPATHWTSTIIDYAYRRGNIQCEGIYVSPSNLSDHRMIVIDWKVD